MSLINKTDDAINEIPIFCIMATQNNSKRAKITVANFLMQTHSNKVMIILNRGTEPVMDDNDLIIQTCKNMYQEEIDKIIELHEENNDVTDEELFERAKEYIPEGSFWCLFLENDWRSFDFISQMLTASIENKAEYITLKHVMYYDKRNDEIKEIEECQGFGTFCEFGKLCCDLFNKSYQAYVHDYSPKIYIHTGTNKYMAVDTNKKNISYVRSIINTYY